MRGIDHLVLANHLQDLDRRVRQEGIGVTIESDFEKLLAVVRRCEQRGPLTPIFDPRHSDIGPHNGFWLHGTDAYGRTAHVQAVRCDDLGARSLADHLAERILDYRPPAEQVDPEGCCSPAPAARQLRGRLCYHGEMWIRPGGDGFRARGLLGPLNRLGVLLAHATWDPDWVWAIVAPDLVDRGLPSKSGYMHMQPKGVGWLLLPEGRRLWEWLIWSGRDDLTMLSDCGPERHLGHVPLPPEILLPAVAAE